MMPTNQRGEEELAMDSAAKKPHAICLPFPGQGHIGAMLKLAKLLHHKGFHITFVNTEDNHNRICKSRGPNSLNGLPGFRFETIPDGLPRTTETSETDSPNVVELYESISKNGLIPLRDLILKLNGLASRDDSADFRPASCIVYDAFLAFAVDAAEEVGIPAVAFWPFSAMAVMCFYHFRSLLERGIRPPRGENDVKNECQEQMIDWIPGIENMPLKDFNTIVWKMNAEDLLICSIQRTYQAFAVIVNTFDALEHKTLEPLSSMIHRLYAIGPIHLLLKEIPKREDLAPFDANLWREDDGCIEWLDSKDIVSVVYVNFGSIATVTKEQLVEFAWGLAQSMQNFLWIIRPDLITEGPVALPPEFLAEIKERGKLASWCNQEQVLDHPSIGGFLTHCGWNSIVESLSAGVPMICWPYFGDQPTNCFCCTQQWNIAMEMDNDTKNEQIEKLVRELMEGEKGKVMRGKALEWKNKAQIAARPGGSAYLNVDKLIQEVLLST